MSLTIDVDVSDLIAEWQDKGVRAVNVAIADAVQNACIEGANEAVNSRIYQDRTAHLTASIHGDQFFVLTADGAEGQITAGESYASYVNDWERSQNGGEHGFIDLGEAKARDELQQGLDRIDITI